MVESSQQSSPIWLKRTRLTVAGAAAYGLGLLLSRLAGVPDVVGFDASLLAQRSPAIALGAACLAVLAGASAASLIAGRVRRDAGLLGAAAALGAMAARGGVMGDTLRAAPVPGTFLRLAIEAGLLLAALVVVAAALSAAEAKGLLPRDTQRDDAPPADAPVGTHLMALGATSLVLYTVLWFVAITDQKAQAMAAVAVATAGATIVVHQFFFQRCAAWAFWPVPLVVGAASFAIAVSQGNAWGWNTIGLTNMPVARPLPLHFAAAGTIAALVGYWMSRGWHAESEDAPAPSPTDGPTELVRQRPAVVAPPTPPPPPPRQTAG